MIIQVGSYPLPMGGISIYIKRMKEFLDSKNIENQVWDTTNKRKNVKSVKKIWFPFVPFLFAFQNNSSIIHYNVPGKLSKVYIGFFNRLLFKNRKKIITLHGDCRGFFYQYKNQIVRSLNSFDKIICVKEGDKQFLQSQGITSDIYEIPAFIPPIPKEKDFNELSKKLWDFIDTHSPIISANASKIDFYKGIDLYGIDLCIDLIKNLIKDYPKIGLIFSISKIADEKYYKKMLEKINNKGIEKNFLFYTKPHFFYPIIMKSNLFIRPTITDGDAVSIREALYFKIPTIASDAVKRPENTILFKNRDLDDMIIKVKDVLYCPQKYQKKLKLNKMEDYSVKILDLYS